MRTALGSWLVRLSIVGCALLLTAGCSATERDDAGSVSNESSTAGSTSSAAGHAEDGQDLCALLTDEQVSTYLGNDVPEPERSNEFDRPTCTWDGETIDKVEVGLWNPPIRSIITDDADRTIKVGEHKGYIQTESETSCKINIEGPEKFLNLQVSGSEKTAEDGHLCTSVAEMAQGVINDLDW